MIRGVVPGYASSARWTTSSTSLSRIDSAICQPTIARLKPSRIEHR
jgi:hypothetical protein